MGHSKPVRLKTAPTGEGESVHLFLEFTIKFMDKGLERHENYTTRNSPGTVSGAGVYLRPSCTPMKALSASVKRPVPVKKAHW